MMRSPSRPLWKRDASELAAAMRRGEFSAEEVAESLLGRVAEREPALSAWAWIDAAQVRRQARHLASSSIDLPLYGVPVGVKDIFDTNDMPTACGSPIYAGLVPGRDAAAVARLRAAGAVIMGKTATTEFAHAHPAATVNPLDPARTPGGSSSGSAAAVADAMVPLALGSQTGGSTIRPSAYCGIVGFKPTFGRIATAGMKALAPSMDTVGIHARSVHDAALLFSVLAEAPAARPGRSPQAHRIRHFPGPYAAQASDAAMAALERCRHLLVRAGWDVQEMDSPSDEFPALSDDNRTIMAYEAAQAMRVEFDQHREKLSSEFASFLQSGRDMPSVRYEDAIARVVRCRRALDARLGASEVLMTLSAPGEAPLRSEGTGSSVFNRAWTTLGVPCLTLPFGSGPAGLPLGVQLIARHGDDVGLLAVGAEIARTIGVVPARAESR
jgi:Asp-tRNA(Asn)/Glu-tRNA(Gln) amidotransferase A subunit family amidase